jgi:hypothetical protein
MKYLPGLVLFLCVFCACQKEADPRFSISADGVGPISKTSTIAELDVLFASDSIVRPDTLPSGRSASEVIEVYEKGGKLLLSISQTSDSIPGIANIRIRDPRYMTPEGINVGSTFKDIREKLKVKKVITSLNNVVILIKDSDVYFTISKEELPAELRFVNTDIDMIQIPDKAKIKYMMIGWN